MEGALVQLQVWVNNNDGTARVVNTHQKVLTEATLLTAGPQQETSGRPPRPVTDDHGDRCQTERQRTPEHAPVCAVIEGASRSSQALKTIVTVNNTTIQIV